MLTLFFTKQEIPVAWFRNAMRPRNVNQRLLFPALRILVMLYTIPAAIVWLGSGLMGLDPGTRALCCECHGNPPELGLLTI
jgi:hypothetical protein